MTDRIIIIERDSGRRPPCRVCKGKGKVPDLNDPWVINLGSDLYPPPWKRCTACDGTGVER